MASTMPAMSTEHLVANYNRNDLRFERGEGVWLIADDGRRYLDALSGIAVNALGHGHPALTAAIREQAGQLLHTSNLFRIGPQETLADRICANSFGERVYFCNSGAEANEACYKLVRLWGNVRHAGRKTRLVTCEGGFHGRTMGALAVTANPAYREPFAPMPEVTVVPFGDAEALAAAVDDRVAGVWIEPLQGEGGVRVPPEGYLAAARRICSEAGALLVYDEVQVGCGRTGLMFGHQHEADCAPDCMALAKGLGGGVPIGAMVTTAELAALMKPGTHASTFGGNHLACAAGCAVFDILQEPGFLTNVAAMGERLMAGLRARFPGKQVRGRGLLVGVALEEAPGPLVKACLCEGLVAGVAGGNVLRFAPPLVIAADEVDELLARLDRALAQPH